MKKVIIALAAIALVASACSKEQTVNTKDFSFMASINAVEVTKATLGVSEVQQAGTFYPVQFVAGDEVAVKNISTGAILKFTAVNGGDVAKFVVSPDNLNIPDDFMSEDGQGYYMCYPYDDYAVATVSANQVQVIGNAATGGIAMESNVGGNLETSPISFNVTSTILKVVLDNPVEVDYIEFFDGNDIFTLTCEALNAYPYYMMGINTNVALGLDASVKVYGDAFPYDAQLDENSLEKVVGAKTLTPGKLITVKIHN